MMSMLKEFSADRSGNTVWEVALLVMLVGVPVIAAMEGIKLAIAWAYNDMQGALSWSGSLL